jgi:hypothetical protein
MAFPTTNLNADHLTAGCTCADDTNARFVAWTQHSRPMRTADAPRHL